MCSIGTRTLLFSLGTSTLIGLGHNAFTALDALDPRIMPALLPLGVKTTKTTRTLRESLDKEPVVLSNPPLAGLHTFRCTYRSIKSDDKR